MKPYRGILLGLTGSLFLAVPSLLAADSSCRDNAQARSLRLRSAGQAKQVLHQAGKINPRQFYCQDRRTYCRDRSPSATLNRSEQISRLGQLIRARKGEDAS